MPILILGESGTGKEILAHFIHSQSPWREGPFVKVNCPAIPGTLLESELFGFEKGAFTGAIAAKPGRMETASGGTLFLDEIAELDASLQAKLLHVLQDGSFTRIGGHDERRMDARVICATNRHLQTEIESGGFRSDLFYRINVISIVLPLCATAARTFLQLSSICGRNLTGASSVKRRLSPGKPCTCFSSATGPATCANWKTALARYVILGSEEAFYAERTERKPGHVAYEITEDGKIPLKSIAQQVTRRMERDVILKVLQANQWNRRKAAEVLKISYRALLYKVRQAGLPAKRPRQKVDSHAEFSSTAPPAD